RALATQRETLKAAARGTTCPTPTSVEHADIRVKNYNVNSRERYVCNSGFKRKAGTSTLTECVLNKTTNVAHWTTPNLKCIRDPTLARQRPVPPSTVVTPRATPEPKSPSPPGKEIPTEPEALSPKPNTTVASETALVPGSQLAPSQPPSAGTTGTGSHESSQAPSPTTAKTLEPSSSTSLRTPGVSPHSSKTIAVAVSTSFILGSIVFAVLLACYLRSRQTSRPPRVEVETMEAVPMTVRTSTKEEDMGT
ncbi:interleukin-15 receptor subunit alpha, partial [Nannospalax galili]|uniref:interleukin-15 receptor subunit alpha n=1 Tax=Nannospalax galili TaxID=1026970 RepID=UPI00081A1EB2